MSRASERRERLASPLGLAVAAAAFIAAFALLAPPRGTFTLTPDETDAAAAPLDELTFAYLRARAAGGELGDEEALAAVTSLAGEGRVAEARALLAASPERAFDRRARVRLDLELAAGELRRAIATAQPDHDSDVLSGREPHGNESARGEPDARTPSTSAAERHEPLGSESDEPAGVGSGRVGAARSRLAAELARLLRRPPLQTRALLERAALLSERIDDVRLAAAIERRLAEVAPTLAADRYARCGRRLAAAGFREGAIDCFERARLAGEPGRARFALGLALLAELSAEAVTADRASADRALSDRAALADTLLDEASSLDALSAPDALASLADALLAAELPHAAARAYARLAERDEARRVRWLGEAARWAEAAERPAEAAAYLDAMTPSLAVSARAAHERRIETLLLGAGRQREVLERLAARLARDPLDPAALRAAVAAARALGEEGRALGWNTVYLGAHADDGEAIERQIVLTLALGRTDLARRWSERALARAPDDAAHLSTLARLAEWAGEPDAALRYHRRLLGVRSGVDAADTLLEIARLAERVRRPAVAADALERHIALVAPDRARIERVVRLHELDGRPDRAAATLEASMRWHGTRASTLTALAALHQRHVRYPEALDAWERLAARYGRSDRETLSRVELLWRLGHRDEAAALATSLGTSALAGEVSDYQVTLLAEIGWRYRLAGVAALARPLLATLEDEQRRLRHGRRAVRAAIEAGELAAARRDAETLWRASGEPELGLLALRLAVENDEREAGERLFEEAGRDERLREESGYWSLRASASLRDGDADAARRAWERALGLSPDDVEALGGLLWLHIDDGDEAALATALERAAERAAGAPALWTAFAVAHLRLGDVEASLPWFERALDAPKADYGLWLTYADALEDAGRTERARRVRRHAIADLRSRLREALADDRDELLRQYGRLLARHGGAAANEAWMRRALDTTQGSDASDLAWREDMAIAWLMATERHAHARAFMARLHDSRLARPAWQTLALALRADDEAAVAAVLETRGGDLSAGDRILALRRSGREDEAWRLARRTIDDANGAAVPGAVAERYASMRRHRPNDAAARFFTRAGDGLSIEESGLSLRRTLGDAGIGVGIDVARRRFDPTRLDAAGGGAGDALAGEGGSSATRAAFELSLFRSDERRSAELNLGVVDDAEENRPYGSARHARRDAAARRELALGLGWNEPADGSPELRLGATRSHAGLGVESGLGERLFTRLGAELDELETRVTERRLARGLTTRAELGLRGGLAVFDWSASLAAEDVRRDRASRLPDELTPGATLDGVLARRASTLSLNASLSRGPIGGDIIGGGTGSAAGGALLSGHSALRYYLSGGLSHVWPERAVGLRIDGGAGFRVLGGDELAIAFTRDTVIAGARAKADVTTLGLSYRRRF